MDTFSAPFERLSGVKIYPVKNPNQDCEDGLCLLSDTGRSDRFFYLSEESYVRSEIDVGITKKRGVQNGW